MTKVNELLQKRKKALDEAHNLANSDNFSAEQNSQFDALMAEAAGYKDQIEKISAAERERAAIDGSYLAVQHSAGNDGDDAARRHAVFNNFLHQGFNSLSDDDKAFFQANFKNPQSAQTVGTANKGGYTVPESFSGEVEKAQKEYNSLEAAGASVLETENGQDIPWPTINDTTVNGRLITESTSSQTTDMTFGEITLKASTFTSDLIIVSNELMQDTGIDLVKLIGEISGERLGRIQNSYFTTGTGTAQPQGVVTGSVEGKVAADDVTVTVDELIDLQFSVGRAYRKNGTFMMPDEYLAKLVKMKDSEGRPIFVPSYREGELDRLLNKPVVVNDDMADIEAAAKTILFGDFSKYRIRRVKGLLVRRLEERFGDENKVAFITFQRADGRLMDAGTNPIKHLKQAAS